MNTAAILHPFPTFRWILQTCSQDLQWWLDDHDHHHHHIVMIRMMITITLMITQSTMIWILLPKFASLHRSHALMIATWCLDTLTNKENYDHCIQYTSTCSTQASTNHEQLNKWLIKLQLNINLPVPPRPRPHENRRGIRHTACPEKHSFQRRNIFGIYMNILNNISNDLSWKVGNILIPLHVLYVKMFTCIVQVKERFKKGNNSFGWVALYITLMSDSISHFIDEVLCEEDSEAGLWVDPDDEVLTENIFYHHHYFSFIIIIIFLSSSLFFEWTQIIIQKLLSSLSFE